MIEESQKLNNLLIMLDQISNLNGIELLNKEQQKKIVGKGDGMQAPRCLVYAPPGSTSAQYPYYPCAHNPTQVPTLCPDPLDDFAPPIIC